MKTIVSSLHFGNGLKVWEDLVNDYLEVAGSLTGSESRRLVRLLRRQGPEAEAIDVHPAFSIDGHVVIVCRAAEMRECWLYDPKKRKIVRQVITV